MDDDEDELAITHGGKHNGGHDGGDDDGMYDNSTVALTGPFRTARGRQLLVTAESTVLNLFCRRVDMLGPSMWVGSVSEDAVTSIDAFARTWGSSNPPLSDDLQAALYVRFGAPYAELWEKLGRAASEPSPGERRHAYEMAWDAYRYYSVDRRAFCRAAFVLHELRSPPSPPLPAAAPASPTASPRRAAAAARTSTRGS
jgi:hypothetical protein